MFQPSEGKVPLSISDELESVALYFSSLLLTHSLYLRTSKLLEVVTGEWVLFIVLYDALLIFSEHLETHLFYLLTLQLV